MIRFVVPGIPHIRGYYAEGKQPNWKRKKEYEEWKDHVRGVAFAEGLDIPLEATKEAPLYVVTQATFHTGTHPDCENIHKSIVDSLVWVSPEERKFGQKRGSDKYFGGMFMAPAYGAASQVVAWVMTPIEFKQLCHNVRLGWQE